jgi:hypothetical protein
MPRFDRNGNGGKKNCGTISGQLLPFDPSAALIVSCGTLYLDETGTL